MERTALEPGIRSWLLNRVAPIRLPKTHRPDTNLIQPKLRCLPEEELGIVAGDLASYDVPAFSASTVSEDRARLERGRISVNICLMKISYEEIPADSFLSLMVSEDISRLPDGQVSGNACCFHVSYEELPPDAEIRVVISGDLFHPIQAGRNGGKHYTGAKPETLFSPTNPLTPNVTRHEGFRQAFVERKPGGRVDPSRVMSIWERILPLLQPPLLLDFPRTLDLPSPLWPYQVDGVRFLLENQSALLGDDMGTGKTVQATVAMRFLFQTGKISSALIVCPLSVLRHWDRHLETWAPLLSPNVVRGNKDRRQGVWQMPAHVWITTYDTLRQDIELVCQERGVDGFDLVILDEVQKIKNPETLYSKATKQLKPQWRWGFSGTPIENRIDDLVSIFDFIKPGLFQRSAYYGPAELRDHIQPYFLRRKKEVVLKELPEKVEFDEWIPLEGAQRQAYEDAERTGGVYLRELGERVTVHHVLALLTRLKQLCNVDHATGESAKTEWIEDFLEELEASEDKAIIFSQYLGSGVDTLTESLRAHTPLRYVGGMSEAEREKVLWELKSHPQARLLLMSRAGGLGIDLVAANYVVHFDHWWNPAVVKQAEDRVHRIGQKKKVFVYHLWTEGTVEERIYSILEKKRQLYSEVIDPLSNVDGTGLSEEELFELFGLESPKKKRKPDATARFWKGKSLANKEDLLQLAPEAFEDLTAELYVCMGYGIRRTPASRDRGVDIVATRQKASVAGTEKIAVQCKRYEHPVGEPIARNLLGALAADPSFTKGVIVTCSTFSQDCKTFSERNGRLELVDGDLLLRLIHQYLKAG